MAIVLRAHRPFFVIDGGFLMFKMRRLPGRKLAALYSLGNALLLVNFAIVDVGVGLRLSASGSAVVRLDVGLGLTDRRHAVFLGLGQAF